MFRGIVLALLLCGSPAIAQVSSVAADSSTAVPDGMPNAERDFCSANVTECASASPAIASDSELTLVERINEQVDSSHKFIDDVDHYHVPDRWNVLAQNEAGDCEDFALTKRHDLMADGIPSGAMMMAIVGSVWTPHMVLLVRLQSGTWILDNMKADIIKDDGSHDYAPVATTAWGNITEWRMLARPTL